MKCVVAHVDPQSTVLADLRAKDRSGKPRVVVTSGGPESLSLSAVTWATQWAANIVGLIALTFIF